MAALLILLGVVPSGLATLLTVLSIREKLRPAKRHPLDLALRDIAAAIREGHA